MKKCEEIITERESVSKGNPRHDKGEILLKGIFVFLGLCLGAAFIIGITFLVRDAKSLIQTTGQVIEHQQAIDDITAGIISNKEIINGHKTTSGGVGYNPTTGNYGYIIGGQSGYVPTRYRIYVLGEYEYNGETYQAEVYFDVDAEIYAAYKIGDYFDSQNLVINTAEDLLE